MMMESLFSPGLISAAVIVVSFVIGFGLVWAFPDPLDQYDFWPITTGSDLPRRSSVGSVETEH